MNREVLRHGATGYLPANEGEWVEVVDRLLLDSGLRNEIGMAGRRTVESTYSLESMEKRLLAALDSLPAKPSPRRGPSRD
jgi:glycosyltransferase involved in cell wall biosynthesis